MSGRLEGRVAFVTGAGSGIGRATAIRLAEDGAGVIATSRNLARAEGTRDEIAAAGLPQAEAIELDVADSHQVDRVIGEVAARHRRIDVVVANAGVELPRAPSVEEPTDDEWDRLFAVNARGVLAVCRSALPVMPDGGAIVSVGSINSLIAWPDDAGISIEVIRAFAQAGTPVLGVCLGHQSLVQGFGGKVVTGDPIHGKDCEVEHDGRGIYEGLPSPLVAGRYHSLVADPDLPDELEQTATGGGVIMGVRHRELPAEGVQFHPESVLTPQGKHLLKNFLGA